MSDIYFEEFNSKDFNVRNEEEDGVLSVKLSGQLTTISHNNDVANYFINLHEKIVKYNINKVVLDFTDISVMISSYLNVFFNWFKSLLKLPKEDRYKLELIYDKESDWQNAMFMTIERVLSQT